MPKIIPTTKDVEQIEDMAAIGLTLEDISKILRWSEKTLKRRMEDTEGVREAYERGRATAKQIVLKRLFELIQKGNPAAIFFYLKCQCGWREAKESIGERPIENITIYLPKKQEEEQ